MEYKPYKGLISLQNNEPVVETGFNATGYRQFIEDNFEIVDKDKLLVPFKLKPCQLDLIHHMENYLQITALKSRKMGLSSAALGVATTKFLLGSNENCVSVSFSQDAAKKQLLRAKQYIRSYETKNGIKLETKYNTKTELQIENADQDENGVWKVGTCSLRVGSAKAASFGRGDDITFLHITEVASAPDLYALLASVGEALVRNAHLILEWTAEGFNDSKKHWDESIAGITGFAPLFYSPYWEYDDEYLEIRRKKLGRLFPQEYPKTPEEAFLTSGETYFDKEALSYYSLRAKELNA